MEPRLHGYWLLASENKRLCARSQVWADLTRFENRSRTLLTKLPVDLVHEIAWLPKRNHFGGMVDLASRLDPKVM
jgi:hypothetical protein